MFLKILISVLLLLLQSCKSTKDITVAGTKSTTQETKMAQNTLLSQGYSIGLIKYLENSDCPYIIIDEKTNVKFDPINIDEAKFMKYKYNQSKIYYKYRPLRMMNRCNEAQPISIEDIKKREY